MSNKLYGFIRRNTSLLSYLCAALICLLILVFRYPNMLGHPNFYAEDGSVFFQNSLDKGFFGSLFSTFNGYFVVGLYLILGLANLVNSLLGHSILYAPFFLSLISMAFFAAVIALPVLLFRKELGRASTFVVALLGVTMPLPVSLDVVVGNLGNQKFTFTYLAFLAITYLALNRRSITTPLLFFFCLIIIICAYTSSVTYLLMPLLLAPVIYDLITRKTPGSRWILKKHLVDMIDKYLLAVGIMVVLIIPQLIYIAINGMPDLDGYLDTPFKWGAFIEIFINRTLLFGLTHSLTSILNDIVVVAILIAVLALGFKLRYRSHIFLYWSSIYAAFVSTALFVVNRPGVSDFFMNYKIGATGPDQFFFVQTLLMYVAAVLGLGALGRRKTGIFSVLPTIFLLIIFAMNIISSTSFDVRTRNRGIYENYNPSFIDASLSACQTKDDREAISAYVPGGHLSTFVVRIPHDKLCTSELNNHFQRSADRLGLTPNNNNYITINQEAVVKQKFTATHDGLDGVSLLLSNFGKDDRQGDYTFRLYDGDCKKSLASKRIPSKLSDSSFYRITFDKIDYSKNRAFCFTLIPSLGTVDYLAVQQTAIGKYPGRLNANNKPLETDIVFDLLYSQRKH